jgi:hypothetical protein
VELYPEFLARVSRNDIRMRFLAPRLTFPDDMLRRLTQLDYDRDMAFVAIAEPPVNLRASAACPAIQTGPPPSTA